MLRPVLFALTLLTAFSPMRTAAAQTAQISDASPLGQTLKSLGRPFIIGVAGGSGSGKSTLARDLAKMLGEERVVILSTDDYFRYDGDGYNKLLAERSKQGKTDELRPEEFTDFDALASQLGKLRAGQSITKNIYDHGAHQIRRDAERVAPRPIVIVEGLHPIGIPAIKEKLDVSVFVDPSDGLRFAWKEKRDVAERHMTRDEVRVQFEKELAHHDAFVRPQRESADLLFHFDAKDASNADSLKVQLKNRLGARDVVVHDFVDGEVRPNALDRLQHSLTEKTGVHAKVSEQTSPAMAAARTQLANEIVGAIAHTARRARGH